MWDPYTQDHKTKLDAVQRRAARFVCKDYRKSSSVSQMLQLLRWESLEDRRALSRLSLFFKSINNTAAIDSFRYQTTPSKNSSAISFSRPASKKIAISTRFYQEPSQNGIFYHRTYVKLNLSTVSNQAQANFKFQSS